MARSTSRQRAIQAATRLFADRGYAGTSVQRVADAVGIRKASLLHHFSSKTDLRKAVLDALLDKWRSELPAVLIAATSGHDRFETLVAELIAFFREDPHRARLVVRESLDRPDAMRELLRVHVGPWIAMIADYVRQGQEAGRLHAHVDPEAYVLTVILMAISAVALHGVTQGVLPASDGPDGADRQLRELQRLTHDGLFLPRNSS